MLPLPLLQRWYAAGGYPGGGPKKQAKAATADVGNMSDAEVVNVFSRFFEWYVVEGRPGDPIKSRREVSIPATALTAAI